MSHRHFCDYAGHYWVCEGTTLRPIAGETEPSPCMCLDHDVPTSMEDGDHSQCTVELIACPEHRDEQLREISKIEEEIDRRNAEFGLQQKWDKMQAMPDCPKKDALIDEILTFMFGTPKPDKGETHCDCGCADADPSKVVGWCWHCSHEYVEYSPEIQDRHFAYHCPGPPEKLKQAALASLAQRKK